MREAASASCRGAIRRWAWPAAQAQPRSGPCRRNARVLYCRVPQASPDGTSLATRSRHCLQRCQWRRRGRCSRISHNARRGAWRSRCSTPLRSGGACVTLCWSAPACCPAVGCHCLAHTASPLGSCKAFGTGAHAVFIALPATLRSLGERPGLCTHVPAGGGSRAVRAGGVEPRGGCQLVCCARGAAGGGGLRCTAGGTVAAGLLPGAGPALPGGLAGRMWG